MKTVQPAITLMFGSGLVRALRYFLKIKGNTIPEARSKNLRKMACFMRYSTVFHMLLRR